MSEPYYQDDTVTIYHGDALDVLPVLQQRSAAAVVTDPPYVGVASSRAKTSWADLMNAAHWFATWYSQCARILKPDGSMWTFCNWRTSVVVQRAAAQAGIPVGHVVVWDKEWMGVGSTKGLRTSHELIAMLPMPDFEIESRSVMDVWRVRANGHKPSGHKAEKPVAVVDRILDACELPAAALVVDPFLGSGTTIEACRLRGLRCIGIEADEAWAEYAAKRASGVLDLDGAA